MLEHDIDQLVLGCTHYPFVIPLIQQIAGPGVRVIDPAPAVARRKRCVQPVLALRRGARIFSHRPRRRLLGVEPPDLLD